MTQFIEQANVIVNYGRLLENQLKKWQGGGHHPRGIAEYISNSDDSYRRLRKFSDQEIIVEIHSRTGKMIDKLIVTDFAEGMSFYDLENKFFQYFESFSGHKKGERVAGRFGTGGKAYAIMNFRDCWITSIKDGKECKAWFKWDSKNQQIIRGYNNSGYKDKPVNTINGTTIQLESSLKVSYSLNDFIIHLEKLERNRHILKSQNIRFTIVKKRKPYSVQLKYNEPNSDDAIKKWEFILPENIKNIDGTSNNLHLRYFEKPLGDNSFIDLTDGIFSVSDLMVPNFDSRPFSKYINGSLAITKLIDSAAVKENRKGLEEGDDLTIEIENFLKEKVTTVITEIEEYQRQKDKEKRINATNKNLNELSKFLSKQDLKFKTELKDLLRRFEDNDTGSDIDDKDSEDDNQPIYRKPMEEDSEDMFVKGTWVSIREDESQNKSDTTNQQTFTPNDNGEDFAIKIGSRPRKPSKETKKKKGLQVLMSNDTSNSQSPIFNEFNDPVSDRDLESLGIIWINAVHPIIVQYGSDKENEVVRNENIVNFVLMIVSQYFAQKAAEMQPEDERDNILILFREHFFRLQMEIRQDEAINYFQSS